jgi:F-type H+-transporting ATPase subunit gamma
MPSLKDLKNRIDSVKSTQKITRAMQMVSAAKLRRAQDRAEAARPYSDSIERVLANLAATMRDDPSAPRLLVGTGKDDVHLLVVATADRGLCGAFNTNIVRAARAHADSLLAAGKTVRILCVGKKGRDILKRLYGQYIIDTVEFSGVRTVGFEQAQSIGRRVMEMFEKGEFDVCTIFYARFVSVMSQKPTARQLIPATVGAEGEESQAEAPDLQGAVYEYEPDEESIVATLLPLNLSAQIFRALLENGAGEQGARMAAMDNATRNAGDLIDKLTLQFNRTRQANITRELIEIVSGAEAL